MPSASRFWILLTCISFLLVNGAGAQEGPEQFHSAVAKSNSAYKLAASYLRTGNIDFALLELGASIDSWHALQSRYQSAPPAPYSNDPKWRQYLSEIGTHLSDGHAFLLNGSFEKAKSSLRPVRSLLHQLRQQNGITLFEDLFFDASVHMLSLWQYRHIKVALANAYSRRQLSRAAASFQTAILASDDIASEALKKNAIYQRLMATAKSSTPKMITAIASRDYSVFLRYLRELRSIERMLYLHFG